jgi:hypothetical protein
MGFPPNLLPFTFIMETVRGSLHCLHLFFSTFFLLAKIIMEIIMNNNIIIII